jgi:hypothetical protein
VKRPAHIGYERPEIEALRNFAVSHGLTFARDRRTSTGLRRLCIHEAGHAIMCLGFGIPGWRIEIRADSAELSNPPTAVNIKIAIITALGGPLAEERWCGPEGVFLGAVDDIRQVKEASEDLGLSGESLREQIAKTRTVLERNAKLVMKLADWLQMKGSLSEADFADTLDKPPPERSPSTIFALATSRGGS